MAVSRKSEPRLSAEAFMAWYDARPGSARYELLDGIVHKMQAERLVHAEIKARVLVSFRRQTAGPGSGCQALGDGMAVRVDGETVFEPDALVRHGPPLPPSTTLLEDPVIVVEVASPATQKLDATRKLLRYFRNPSIQHYLIVVPTERNIIHHRRAASGKIESAAHELGVIALDPPGLTLDLGEIFAGM